MKTSKFTEGQIVFMLKQAKDVTPFAEVPQGRYCRSHVLELESSISR